MTRRSRVPSATGHPLPGKWQTFVERAKRDPGHPLLLPIGGRRFRLLLTHLYIPETGRPPHPEALDTAIGAPEARALFGPAPAEPVPTTDQAAQPPASHQPARAPGALGHGPPANDGPEERGWS